MNILGIIIKRILVKIGLIHEDYNSIESLRKRGVKIGNNVDILDSLIDAVRKKDRAQISILTSKVFATGITAVNFAEEIITRARDLITKLDNNQSEEFYFLERAIDQLRKAVVEMHSSGIADIILERWRLWSINRGRRLLPLKKIPPSALNPSINLRT